MAGERAEEVDGFVGVGELFGEDLHLPLEVCDLLRLGVLVLDRLVRNEASLGRVTQSRQVLVHLRVARVQASEHQRVAVSAERLPQQAGQLGVAVRDVALFILPSLSQCRYDLPQGQ